MHSAKSPEKIRALIGIDPPLPDSPRGLDTGVEYDRKMVTSYQAFKDFLVREYRA
jgi:hypothetical protein